MRLQDPKQQSRIHSIIQKVRIGLHPTFGMDYIDVKAQAGKAFEFSCKGWGSFDMPFTIYFKRQLFMKPLVVDHTLQVDGKGKWRNVVIQMNK